MNGDAWTYGDLLAAAIIIAPTLLAAGVIWLAAWVTVVLGGGPR